MNETIRYSTIDDIGSIDKLILESFGKRYNFNVLDNIDGRYLVYEINGEIVAITGLGETTDYKDGLDIDWTCTSNKYREQGIMHKLFSKLLENVMSKVYCSCWRIGDNENINLKSLMNDFGFKCVVKPRLKYIYNYNCPVASCIFQKDGCYCYEDLYLRE